MHGFHLGLIRLMPDKLYL